MAGLTTEGFTPLTQEEITDRIQARLEVISPGFDFSPESPDGQQIEIYSFELSQLWNQLHQVYSSFDPRVASGQALRNIGFISGITQDNASRSYATINLVGTADTLVPAGNEVSDVDGNVFITNSDGVIPTAVEVVAKVAGPTPIGVSSLVNIDTPVTGWTSITQPVAGVVGDQPESEQHYRNTRSQAVFSPSNSVLEALRAKLLGIGLEQIEILANDSDAALADGTPVGHIHVTVTDTTITDADIADAILNFKSLGTPTFGSTAVVVSDSRGESHTINFSKATEVKVEMAINITFLVTDTSGAEDSIKQGLAEYVNVLLSGEDVIWSRLFEYITPYGKAQVNSLNIGILGGALSSNNLLISDTEFATSDVANIAITIV